MSLEEPELARAALIGLTAYEQAPRKQRPPPRPEVARVASAALRDHGGSGRPVVLVPSLINPPRILDLDEQVSLSDAIAAMGRRALLLDWGSAKDRAALSVAGHVEQLLVPMLEELGEAVALIGYCLGGTMSIAAANLVGTERLATIAAPWNFAAYPEPSRAALHDMWGHSKVSARLLGALPMEVLQAAFWSIDPDRTVAKFAEFGAMAAESAEARRFVELEDWANEGEPLPYAAAEELIEGLFGNNLPASGAWRVGGRTMTDEIPGPVLHLTAEHDRIAPAATAPAGDKLGLPSGHVGMIVGSSRKRLHSALGRFLAPCR